MDIQDKIEEIRRQPEHIRMRYVIGIVAVIMFFVVLIWIITVRENMASMYYREDPATQKSIEELRRTMQQSPASTVDFSAPNQQSTTDNKRPLEESLLTK